MRWFAIILSIALLAMLVGCKSSPTEPTNNAPNTPSNPSPADGATNQFVNVDLSWSGGDPDGDSVKYDVYFGPTSPPSLVSDDHPDTTYDLGTLQYNTQYYWKVGAEDEHGAKSEGSIWDFKTERAYWTETKDASGTYYDITGNFYDPDPSWGYPWIALSSYGSSGANAYWSFTGFAKALVETLAVGAYSYDNGWDSDGEYYHVYDHVNAEWDYWGASDKTEKWRGWYRTGSDARRYVRESDGAVLLRLESGWSDHSHIKQVYCRQEGLGGITVLFQGIDIQPAEIGSKPEKTEP